MKDLGLAIVNQYLKIRTRYDDETMKDLIEGNIEEAMVLMDELNELEQKLLGVLAEYDKFDNP